MNVSTELLRGNFADHEWDGFCVLSWSKECSYDLSSVLPHAVQIELSEYEDVWIAYVRYRLSEEERVLVTAADVGAKLSLPIETISFQCRSTSVSAVDQITAAIRDEFRARKLDCELTCPEVEQDVATFHATFTPFVFDTYITKTLKEICRKLKLELDLEASRRR